MTIRTKEFTLVAGQTKQIKISDIEAPIRVLAESGSFTYAHKLNDQSIGAVVPSSDVLSAPNGAWGSELVITCVTSGTIHIAIVG